MINTIKVFHEPCKGKGYFEFEDLSETKPCSDCQGKGYIEITPDWIGKSSRIESMTDRNDYFHWECAWRNGNDFPSKDVAIFVRDNNPNRMELDELIIYAFAKCHPAPDDKFVWDSETYKRILSNLEREVYNILQIRYEK